MDVGEYTQARYGRLLEHAVEVGAPDGLAAAYVDQVLLDQRRRIQRSADPDPFVREALERAIRGQHDHGRGGALAVLLVLAAVVGVGVVALALRPTQRPLPSLAAYDATQGETRLRAEGWDVQLRPVRACDPQDLVTGTDPRAGTSVAEGDLVSVLVAVPYDCQSAFFRRSEAWDVVRWARDLGPAPDLAADVVAEVDGQTSTVADVRRLVGDAAARPTRTLTGMVRLDAQQLEPAASYCGIDQPAALAGRVALRITLDDAPEEQPTDCPLTLDVYRTDDGTVDALVASTAVTAPGA